MAVEVAVADEVAMTDAEAIYADEAAEAAPSDRPVVTSLDQAVVDFDPTRARAVILAEDKNYYPSAEEVYPEAEVLIQEEDTQPLDKPIIDPLRGKQMYAAEPSVPETTPSPEPPADLGRRPAPSEPSRPARAEPTEPGRLQVNVLPWAEVRIDGHDHGRVPVDVELPPGRHRVELRNPQLGRVVKDVELRPGAELEIKEW